MPPRNTPPVGGQLLLGCRAIAACLQITPRQALYLHERQRIPTFRLPKGRAICALKPVLEAFVATQAERGLAEIAQLASATETTRHSVEAGASAK